MEGYALSLLVLAVILPPRCKSVRLTVAPGTLAPMGSVTTPAMLPVVVVCALNAGAPISQLRSIAAATKIGNALKKIKMRFLQFIVSPNLHRRFARCEFHRAHASKIDHCS